MISSALSGSNRGISVSVPPAVDRGVHRAGLAEGVEQRQRAQHHAVGAEVEQRRGAERQFASRFAWVSSAPFGVPVVPEV